MEMSNNRQLRWSLSELPVIMGFLARLAFFRALEWFVLGFQPLFGRGAGIAANTVGVFHEDVRLQAVLHSNVVIKFCLMMSYNNCVFRWDLPVLFCMRLFAVDRTVPSWLSRQDF